MPSDSQIIVILIVAVVALAALWVVRIRHREFNIIQLILWYTAKLIVLVMWGGKLNKPFPIGKDQGAVLVCNHRSSVDPFFIQTAGNRPQRWMVAREYFSSGFIGWFLRTCNAISVGRGGIDTAATKSAIRHAAEGGVVGMFAEGRINTTDEFMLPVRPGAVLIALRARVPILPCYVEGSPYEGSVTSALFKRAKVRVFFGDIFDLSPYFGRESEEGLVGQVTIDVIKKIAELAGRNDFQPKLAGRRWKPTEGETGQVENQSADEAK